VGIRTSLKTFFLRIGIDFFRFKRGKASRAAVLRRNEMNPVQSSEDGSVV
jgi:hypothetical protein